MLFQRRDYSGAVCLFFHELSKYSRPLFRASNELFYRFHKVPLSSELVKQIEVRAFAPPHLPNDVVRSFGTLERHIP